jgi:hypothetical protein
VLAAVAVWTELSLLCGGALVLFLQWGYTLAEAGIFAIISVLMILSLVLQLCLIAGAAFVAPVFEAVLAAGACIILWQRRALLAAAGRGMRRFAVSRWAPLAAFGLCIGVLAARSILVPAGAYQFPRLTNALRLIGLPTGALPGTISAPGCIEPLNVSVLPLLFLRFPDGCGVAGLGVLAYLAIACGTYTLARRHAWPPTAFTATLIVVSLPRLVLQAATPGGELIPAATALFCIACVYRLIERTSVRDLVLLCLGLLFNAFSGGLALAMSCVLAAAAGILMLRRHAAVFWGGLIRRSWRILLAGLPAAVLFSQVWLPVLTAAAGAGRPCLWGLAGQPLNDGGLSGALANSVRYLLQSVDFTPPLDRMFQWAVGSSPALWMESLYRHLVMPLLGNRGAAGPFWASAAFDARLSWFGPAAVLLILPAVVHAAWGGPRRLRVVAVAMIVYFYLAALIPAWAPGNGGFFTSWFACSGYLVAFLLPPWRISRRGLRVLQSVCVLLIAYCLL